MKEAPDNLQAGGALGEQLSFLDPLPFCPMWPTRGTLPDRALKRFLDGDVFDHPDFIDGSGSWRLAAVVFNLRTLGWPVETIELSRPTREHPSRTIALYRLPACYVAEALAAMTMGKSK